MFFIFQDKAVSKDSGTFCATLAGVLDCSSGDDLFCSFVGSIYYLFMTILFQSLVEKECRQSNCSINSVIYSQMHKLLQNCQFINQGEVKIVMKKINTQNRYQYLQSNNKKQYKSSSLNKDGEQPYKRSGLTDNSINFDISCFPFMNEQARVAKIYRSTVKLKLSKEELVRIARLNHSNLINILKITTGHSKLAAAQNHSELYYSFYYEQVPYSLKYVAMYQESLSYILKKMVQINLTKLLVNLSDYLAKFGIYYVFNLGDIGVNRQGEIKIFVSPIHFCEQGGNKIHKSQIYESIDKIVAWWQTTLASNTALNPRSSHIILPSEIGLQDQTSIDYVTKEQQQSFIDKEVSHLLDTNEDEKFISSKPQTMKNNELNNSNKYSKSDFQKINSQQSSKIKKIDEQIKYIRQRLKEKRKIHKVSDSFLQKKDKTRVSGSKGLAQSDRLLKKEFKEDKNNKEDSNIIETIQQNINCINIYTHPKQPKQNPKDQSKSKKMTSQPLFSYKISPQEAKVAAKAKPTEVVIHHPSFDPEDFPNSESISSIDTYEMEVEAQIHPAKAVQKNSPFAVQREISEKNYRPSCDSNQTVKKNQNQVANKHVTESAGPLQFKNFVNNFIKPQFLAKKSNIYEDPLEYQSQTSKSISKKKKKIITDLYQNGKSANSHTQKSSSLNNNQEPNCKKKDNFFTVNHVVTQSPRQNINNIFNRTDSGLRMMNASNNERRDTQFQRRSKCLNESKINQRVKIVLQKTKNAIALLNRVKNCRSPQFNQKAIPQKSSQLY